ncbi:stage II sporulation protein M [Oscillospiraceae bacterium PP1C4]
MNLNTSDLDKMIKQKTERRLSPLSGRQNFLRSFFPYFRGNLLNFSLGILFLAGVLIGTLLVSNASQETVETLKIILGGYIEHRQTQLFSNIVTSTFFSIFFSLIILFFCGFCTISQLLILAVPLFKGLGYGFSIGTLYAQYGTSAIQYVLCLILPTMFFSTLLLLTACRASLLLSITLFRSTLINNSSNNPKETDRYRIKRYCVKYIAFTAICLLISLADAILFYKFSGLFVF